MSSFLGSNRLEIKTDLNEAAGTADACGVRGSGPVGALSDSVGYRERRSL
jgi:hypothetical protein